MSESKAVTQESEFDKELVSELAKSTQEFAVYIKSLSDHLKTLSPKSPDPKSVEIAILFTVVEELCYRLDERVSDDELMQVERIDTVIQELEMIKAAWLAKPEEKK